MSFRAPKTNADPLQPGFSKLISSCKMVAQRHVVSCFSIVVFFSSNYIPAFQALNIGISTEPISDNFQWNKNICSKKCESAFCSAPPLLRYGKYCGVSYSGCPGQKPCDALDKCCMRHDECVESKNNEYLSQECSQKFLKCMEDVKKYSGGHTFEANVCNVYQVIDNITPFIQAALLAGRSLHKP